ncbi:MAG: SH3 domain-containing protein [Clostridia bacterium]|nr:SH3 domain-containing protein [Clostridia bacterium]
MTAPNGSNVRMRKNPSEKAETLRKIPLGERVSVYGTCGEWSCIGYEGISGYMLSAFLEMEGETSPREEEKVELLLDREDALRLQTALADALLQR